MSKPRILTLVGMIFSAALVRVLPHPWNVTPVAAMGLFAGAQFERKSLAFLVPLLAVFMSDLVLGAFYPAWWSVYFAHASVVLIGLTLRHRQNILRVATASFAGSISFFLISNLAHLLSSGMYPLSPSGLMMCYTAALPFFRNTLLGDLFFNAVLFGSFHLAERRFPVLRSSLQAI